MPDHHCPQQHGLHLGELINELVSSIAPYSGLILTVTCCVITLIRLYNLDPLIPKTYLRITLGDITAAQMRSFTNHHVAAGTKILLVIMCAYPLLVIICGNATPQTPYAKGSSVTVGDMMIVSSQIFTGIYIFELFFREKVSVVSCAHHIGAIVTAQAAIAMSTNFGHERMQCISAFDVIAELWPQWAMILYRLHHDNHVLLSRIFYATAILEVVGITTETIIVMSLFGSLWDKWSLSLKVTTPFLHTLFSAAQLWGVWIFYKMGKNQQRKLKKGEEMSPSSGDTAAKSV